MQIRGLVGMVLRRDIEKVFDDSHIEARTG